MNVTAFLPMVYALLFLVQMTVLASCHEENSDKRQNELIEKTAPDSRKKKTPPLLFDKQKEVLPDCIDITFIESLETGWGSQYEDPILTLKGFRQTAQEDSSTVRKLYFLNRTQKSTLKISRSDVPNGDYLFTVRLLVQEPYFDCFKHSLVGTNYVYNPRKKVYLNNRAGSYDQKKVVCTVSTEGSGKETLYKIVFTHRIGKELRAVPMDLNDTLFKL